MNRDNNKHMTLVDLADELTDSHVHIERIPYWDDNRNRKHHEHRVTMPGLLQQMADLFEPVTNPDAGAPASVSKPPGNWAALSDHTVITLAVTKWCWDLRLDLRDTVESNIRQLVGASGGLDAAARARLEKDARRWHTIAKTVTGWRTPPTPIAGAPCPAFVEADDGTVKECGVASLRICYDPAEGYCAACGTVWDGTAVRILAEHVTAYSRAARQRADQARERARAEKRRHPGRLA